MRRFLLGLCIVLINTQLLSQETIYRFVQTDISEALSKIESDYNVIFSYPSPLIQGLKVSKEINANTLEDILNQLFEETEVDFKLLDGTNILLKEKPAKSYYEISGRISSGIDDFSLPFVNILNTRTGLGTVTDSMGFYRWKSDFLPDDQIQISYIGFETIVLPFK